MELFKNQVFWIILIFFNVIVYGLCCLMIIKRKTFTYISVRSSTLLLITNFSNFLINIFLILNKLIESNFISIFYYIFKFMMMISIFLRYERLLACFNINNEDRYNIKKFYSKRHRIQEKFFVRILIGLFFVFCAIIIITNIIGFKHFQLFYTSNNEIQNFIGQTYVWIIWNFIEQFVLITYIFRIFNKKMNHLLSFEIYSLLIISFLYSNFSSFATLYKNLDNTNFILTSLTFLYICLILNGFLPIVMTFCSKGNLSFYFTPKLLNNLYLFLTNEYCYQAFNEYLINKKNNGSFFLKLYTHIMKFKLDCVLNNNNNNNKIQGINEATEIFNNYFSVENYSQLIEQETLLKVREKCQILKVNGYNQGIFDDALQFAFNELDKRFSEFRNTQEFRELYEEINLNSYIHCKMFNIGLINKF